MGTINACDKIMFENKNKKRKYGNKEILHKSPSKTSFRHRIHNFLKRAAELMPQEALTSFTVSDAYR